MLGSEYDAFEASFGREFHNGIRINTLRSDPAEFNSRSGFLLKRIPWTENGFYMDREKKFFSGHPYYHAGLYYIQEASAMLPARLMRAVPGERILDLCAAPGGKSTELAASMKNQGLLVSNDVSSSRAKALVHNIETMGIVNCVVTSASPEKLASLMPQYFDGILIDAPCSGEGMFHKEASMMESWKKTGPDHYHPIQKSILDSAAVMLAPGGRLVYSTCTFSPQENEGTIASFLETHPDFSVQDIDEDEMLCSCTCIDRGNPDWLDLCSEDGRPSSCPENIRGQLRKTLRLWPHHLEGEGHFAAVLRKEGSRAAHEYQAANCGRASDHSLDPFCDFLNDLRISAGFDAGRIRFSGGYVQYLPEYQPNLAGIHILRNGWFLGEIKNRRFEPSGAFARALDISECEKKIYFPADSEEISRYFRCETLEADSGMPPGWCLVCEDEFPAGWCKVSGGRIKNKYPAGWRII